MMEPIRLWKRTERIEPNRRLVVRWCYTMPRPPWSGSVEEYAALPRADFDALVKERDEAREFVRIAAEQRSALCDSLNAATARAERAEALLREARGFLDHRAGTFGLPRLVYRIDSHLDRPTDQDRRGEDGDAIKVQGGQT